MRKISLLLLVMLCWCSVMLSGCMLPTDKQLSKRLEQAVQNQLHPTSITVRLHRASQFSTNVKWLTVTMSGFSANRLPITVATRPADNIAVPGHALLLATAGEKKKSPERIMRLDKVIVQCDDFIIRRLPVKQLALRLLHVQAPMSAMKDGQFAIRSAVSATGAITFDERGLSQYLQTRKIPLLNPQVRLTKEGCILSGETKGLIRTHVEIFGRPAIRNAGILYLEDPKLKVSVLTLPHEVSERLLTEINPLVDINNDLDLPVPIYITKTDVQSGTIRFEAVLAFPKPE